MKIRKGFVSNSSSSSFVCDVCGDSETGFDCSWSELGFYQCEYGHYLCEDELLDQPEGFKEREELEEEQITDSILCPICQFIAFSQDDLKCYLFKKFNISEEEAFNKIKQENKRRKKLYVQEYISYVLGKVNSDMNQLTKEIKESFKSFQEFYKYTRS